MLELDLSCCFFSCFPSCECNFLEGDDARNRSMNRSIHIRRRRKKDILRTLHMYALRMLKRGRGFIPGDRFAAYGQRINQACEAYTVGEGGG